MPLVPLNVVKTWYRTDSFVYKNFKFLFSNPLWNKTVPNGFSLCPYFWLSVFSLFVLRPTVMLALGANKLISVLRIGKILSAADDVAEILFKKISEDIEPVRPFPGFMLLLLIASLGVTTVLVTGFIGMIIWYLKIGTLINSFVLPITLLITLIFANAYAERHRYDKDRCKVENYVHLGCIVSIISAYLLNRSEFVIVISETTSAIWYVIELCGWVIGAAFSGVCRFLADFVVWGIGFIKAGIVAFSWMFVYALLGLLFLTIVTWVSFKFDKIENDDEKRDKQEEKKKQQERENSMRWKKSLFINAVINNGDLAWIVPDSVAIHLVTKHLRSELELFLNSDGKWSPETVKEYHDRVYKIAVEQNAKKKEQSARKAETCKKVSKSVEKVVKPLSSIVRVLFVCLKHIGIFFCLLWELAKARKQGACPYLRFEQPKTSDTSQKSDV